MEHIRRPFRYEGKGWEKKMKRLYKSRKNCVIDGVCGGIGEYLEVDPVLVRIVAVFFLFVGGSALVAYIVGMIIIPKAPVEAGVVEDAQQPERTNFIAQRSEDFGKAGGLIFGIILIAFGAHFLMRNIPFFQYYYLQFWNAGWHYFWPSVLILIGLLVIFKGSRR
jgi:phage shock protein C